MLLHNRCLNTRDGRDREGCMHISLSPSEMYKISKVCQYNLWLNESTMCMEKKNLTTVFDNRLDPLHQQSKVLCLLLLGKFSLY